ncbi:MAG: DoxX family protein [Flavobacteriales bacterium]|nr:DoxX family protein [Flavobacteriales bacterium]
MIFNSRAMAGDLGLLLLRLSMGGTMVIQHGWPKLSGFADRMDKFSDPLGISAPVSLALIVFAEFFCAVLVVLGLWTRAAVIPLLIGMGVIVFVVKSGQTFGERELPILYLCAFLTLFFTGSGRYSIDRVSFR